MAIIQESPRGSIYRATVRQFPTTIEIGVRLFDDFTKERVASFQEAREFGIERRRGSNEAQGAVFALGEVESEEADRQARAEENLERSARRARQKVRWTAKCLEADHMVTLTYRDNMTDRDALKADFKRFMRAVTAKYPAYKYVAVVEAQDRGALHIHMAVKGYQDVNYLRACWYRALGGSIHDKGAETRGAVNVRAPSRRWGSGKRGVTKWKVGKLASYITKYLAKGFEEGVHCSKRYWASKGIVKPLVKSFWLTAQTMAQMLADVIELAEMAGANAISMADTFQSWDGTFFWLSADRSRTVCMPTVDIDPFGE